MLSAGGERILEVFEHKLHGDLHALPFDDILDVENVRRIINQADGLKPHLIAPEAGYRRLLKEGLKLMRDPAQNTVEEVHRILLAIVDLALHSEKCKQLSKYSALMTEITNCAVTQLGKFLCILSLCKIEEEKEFLAELFVHTFALPKCAVDQRDVLV